MIYPPTYLIHRPSFGYFHGNRGIAKRNQPMNTVAFRDLQLRGTQALDPEVNRPVLVTGQSGPLFFLVPVDSKRVVEQEAEITRAMARADLRSWQTRAVDAGMNVLSDQEINGEIAAVRPARRMSQK